MTIDWPLPHMSVRVLHYGNATLSFLLLTPPMTIKFELRPYQKEAIEAVSNARTQGMQRALICLPTGAGKTVIFSELAQRATHDVLVLAHREELLHQAKDKLERALQGRAKVSIEQGSHHADPDARVVVCSIRSLSQERLARLMYGRRLDLLIYDECHHAAAEDNMRVLRQIGAFEQDWPGMLVGFTATTSRGDGKGLDTVFQEIIFDRDVTHLIQRGYLCKLRGYRIATEADLVRVGVSGADLNLEALSEAVDIEQRNALVARSIQELARERRTIAFCVTVSHAKNLSKALNQLGVPAGYVHGEMKREDRARVLAAFRSGELHVITNVGVLTEGFDDPGVSCIAMARPTRNSGLYTQCVGRGTRLHPGKEDCLVLDFVDLSDLSLVTLPSLFGMPKKMDLDGEEITEAMASFQQMSFDYPTFEFEAEGITLTEIQMRAQHFDPLTLHVDPEVRAVSPHDWISLGQAGIALHFMDRDRLREYLILDTRASKGKRWRVHLDQEQVAEFSKLVEAVEAVGYELQRWGAQAISSALPDSSWRHRPANDTQRAQLAKLRPPRIAQNYADALRLLAHARYARRVKWGTRATW